MLDHYRFSRVNYTTAYKLQYKIFRTFYIAIYSIKNKRFQYFSH